MSPVDAAGPGMRVVILSTEGGWSMRARILAMIGTTLQERGAHVRFVCCRRSPADRVLTRDFPSLAHRTVSARSTLLRVAELRAIVRTERPSAVLVHTERDELVAALAMGRRGGVVRRVGIGQRPVRSWRTRLAVSRSRCLLLGDDGAATTEGAGPARTNVGWPRRDEGPVASPPRLPSHAFAIVAGRSPLSPVDDAQRNREHIAGALALRVAAKLMARHARLRVLLVGESAAMQALRLHAGSLGLADRLSIIPLEALVDRGPFDAAVAWVTTEGDEGAVSLAAAMSRRIPVVVPRGADTERLVAPRITGFLADETELPALVSSLAHLMADEEEYQRMGAAAAARAERLHGWDAYVTRVETALQQVSVARRDVAADAVRGHRTRPA